LLISHAGGIYPAKPPIPIIGDFLSLESDWYPALGDSLVKNIVTNDVNKRIDIGCAAAHGTFKWSQEPHKKMRRRIQHCSL
jgi:hypothetical protein